MESFEIQVDGKNLVEFLVDGWGKNDVVLELYLNKFKKDFHY